MCQFALATLVMIGMTPEALARRGVAGLAGPSLLAWRVCAYWRGMAGWARLRLLAGVAGQSLLARRGMAG